MLKIWAQGGVYTKYKGLRGFCMVGMNSQTQITYFYMYYTLIHSMDFRVRHILDFKMADITAAILVNRAVIAEIPPSGLLSPRVSLSQNKCQN